MASLILDAGGAFLCVVGIVNFFMTLRQMKRETNGRPMSDQSQSNDWDSWLFSHPSFRQRFAELTRSTSPPTYDETLRREQQQEQPSTSRNEVPNEPPPPYSISIRSGRNTRRVKRYHLPPPMVSVQRRP